MKLNVNGFAAAVLRAGVLVSAALLASCGGGGSQVQTFVASRVFAFGDESSLITATQKKYSVNAVVTGTSTLDCASNPIWIQFVAARYGLVFPQCAGAALDPASRIYATNGAKVVDLAGQINQQLNLSDGFKSGDLVTVLIGTNDVVAQFLQVTQIGEGQATANLDAAGRELAAQVNRMAELGAKVLVSTIADVGLAPYAGDRSVGSANGNPAVLSRLSAAFNIAMLSNLTNDGHKIGLIQFDEYMRALDNARIQGFGTYANTTLASCTVALPDCTTVTQVTEATTTAWLWADSLHFGPGAQTGLGSLAQSRLQNIPF